MNVISTMLIHNLIKLLKSTTLKLLPYTGLHRFFYARKKLKTYFLHRVVSADHPYYEYHVTLDHLTISDFEDRLKYIMKHNRLITLKEYNDIVVSGKPIRENIVLLTFDDGYRCLFTNVFPILKKYNVPAVVFLTGNCIERQEVPFHDCLLYALIQGTGKHLCIDFNEFKYSKYLNDKVSVCKAYSTISNYLKSVHENTRQAFQSHLINLLSVDVNTINISDEMLTWEQLKEMYSTGLLDIGAHTMNHPILSKLDVESIKNEIVDSKVLIEKRLNIPVIAFAYPNGRLIDVNKQVLNIVSSEFSLSFCTLGRPWNDDRFLITRHGFDITPKYLLPLIDSGFIDPFATYRLSSHDKISYMNDPHRLPIPNRMLL